MSDQSLREQIIEEAQINAIATRAQAVITQLCNGEITWTMSVPARPDDDPDLILSAAISDLQKAAIRALSAAPNNAPQQGDFAAAREDAPDRASGDRGAQDGSEIVGHKTFRDGHGFRHEPLTRLEADKILAACDAAEAERTARYPTEQAAVSGMCDTWQRLKALGWRDARYAPADSKVRRVIEVGSSGIHEAYCQPRHQDDPDGEKWWWSPSDGDLWPCRPVLYFPDAKAPGGGHELKTASSAVAGESPDAQDARWISVSERLPPESEHSGDTVSQPVEVKGVARWHFPTSTWARLDFNITHWRAAMGSPTEKP